MPAVRTLKLSVLGIRELTDAVYVLRFERGDIDFIPGQHLRVGSASSRDLREYSIYSPPSAGYLEILVREMEEGLVSTELRRLRPGQFVQVQGPFGHFTLPADLHRLPLYFIATGTGISPFHCFVQSWADLDYTLLHGVRLPQEDYEMEHFQPGRTVRCISRDSGQGYPGRVTAWLQENPLPSQAAAWLCGNCDMIYEAYDILYSQGIPRSRIFTEVYF